MPLRCLNTLIFLFANRELLRAKADTTIGNDDIGADETALCLASRRRKVDQVELLLKYGASATKSGRGGMTPLHMAGTFEAVSNCRTCR